MLMKNQQSHFHIPSVQITLTKQLKLADQTITTVKFAFFFIYKTDYTNSTVTGRPPREENLAAVVDTRHYNETS